MRHILILYNLEKQHACNRKIDYLKDEINFIGILDLLMSMPNNIQMKKQNWKILFIQKN